MAATSQTIFSDAFSGMKSFVFWLTNIDPILWHIGGDELTEVVPKVLHH